MQLIIFCKDNTTQRLNLHHSFLLNEKGNKLTQKEIADKVAITARAIVTPNNYEKSELHFN